VSTICGLDQVGSAIFGLGLVWKISPKNPKISIFFSLSQAKKYLGQRQVGLLFTAGQNYARVGSGYGTNVYSL